MLVNSISIYIIGIKIKNKIKMERKNLIKQQQPLRGYNGSLVFRGVNFPLLKP